MRFDLNSICNEEELHQYSSSTEFSHKHSEIYKSLIKNKNFIDGKMTFEIPVFLEN